MIRHGDTTAIRTTDPEAVIRWHVREARAAGARAASVQEQLGVCDSCARRPAGHGHFALYCLPCSELPYGVAAPVSAYCGNYPDADHTGCPSSVECFHGVAAAGPATCPDCGRSHSTLMCAKADQR